MSLVEYLKKKKHIAVAEKKLDLDSRGRLTADMFHDIYKNETNKINHRMKFIQKDLANLVQKN